MKLLWGACAVMVCVAVVAYADPLHVQARAACGSGSYADKQEVPLAVGLDGLPCPPGTFPLPSGASTSALQTAGNTILSTISSVLSTVSSTLTSSNTSLTTIANNSTAQGQATTTTTTIASGGSLSAAIDLSTSRLGRIAMPAAWTAAGITFQSSPDNITYNDLYDSSGNEYTITAAASRGIIIPLVDFISIRYLKVRSGTSASAVNQGADRVLTLVLVR